MQGVDVDPHWWTRFGDPVLSQLVAQTLANNTDIGEAAARVEQAAAQVRGARSYQLPQVTASATGYPRERILSQTRLEGVDLSQYQAQLAVSYDADIFGQLRSQTAAARAQYLAADATRDGVRIAVVASVVAGYCRLRALDATRQVLDDTHSSLAREFAMRTHQRAAGQVAQDVVLQASAAMHQVEQQQASLQQDITAQENALALLLGDGPHAIPRGTPLMALPLLPAAGQLPSQLLRRRPDIAAAEERLLAADHSLSASRAAFLPNLSLGGTLGHTDADVYPSPVNLWSLFGSVLAPLFEGGRLRANEDAAAARRDEAAYAYRASVLNAFREVEDQLAAQMQTAREEKAAAATQDENAGIYAHAQRRFEAGQGDYFKVIDAQRNWLQAQLAFVQVRYARLAATVKLYQAAGGGWRSPNETEPPLPSS
jgi:NodT family efflux transporter outer membrane factor (OMF) lipoprotein